MATPTSITDLPDYLAFCRAATSDPEVFATFRRQPVYVAALEHVTYEQGQACIDVIRRDNPELLLAPLDAARANDRVGSPTVFDYESLGQISPVTLRYLKIMSDLERCFGDLSGKDIIEIGVGYGGQCRVILSRWNVRSYTLVDLEPALALARAYLERFHLTGADGPVRFRPSGDQMEQASDLCISNYAFSELAQPVQEQYVKSILSRAGAGYLVCNFVSKDWSITSMDRDELAGLHRDALWLPEEPLTHPSNAVLVWGMKDRPAATG